MPTQAIDPGIVGPAYQAPMTLQDAENCINFYCEVAEVDGAKEPVALLGTPGLNPFLSALGVGPVRGGWVLPGGQQALIVSGSGVYLVKITLPATPTQNAQCTTTLVGTLKTIIGPVTIRDNGTLVNGLGGYAVIVDGPYGYYYLIQGYQYVFSFAGALVNGSTTITLPGALPNGLIISPGVVLAAIDGKILAGTTIVSVNTIPDPNITIVMSSPASGTNASDTINVTVPVFGQITDPGFLGSNRIAFIEGWLIFAEPNTRTFYTTGPIPYSMLFPGLFYALKDSSTDNIVTFQENERELWLVGERTSEVWYNSGSSGATAQGVVFARVPGVGPQIGCSAWASITRMGDNLVWLAQNEQGQNVVVETIQYSWQRISNHAIDTAIASYGVISDAIGYCYEEAGHLFYVLTFPTQDVTWVYDSTVSAALRKPTWHQRAYFDPLAAQYHRHRSNMYINFAGIRMVGDFQNGQLYEMSRSFYTDGFGVAQTPEAYWPLRAQRRSKHVWKKPNRTRVFQTSLQIEFTPGVGNQPLPSSPPPAANPQAMLRMSNDGGFTWGPEHWRSIGTAGQTKNRCKWNRLGSARDRVYEVTISDPVPRDLIGATLFGETEDSM